MLTEHREIIGFVKTLNWIVLLVLGLMSFWLMKYDFTAGVILGGLLAIVNFDVLERSVLTAFSPSEGFRLKKATAILKYFLRLLFLAVVIYIFLKQSWIHPVGLIAGLSIVVISIIGLGLRMLFKPFQREP